MKTYNEYIAEINAINDIKDISKLDFINDFEVLNLRDESGTPIAFTLFQKGHSFTDNKILLIQNSANEHDRIAAQYVDKGYKPYSFSSETLVERMAGIGHVFEDMDLLKSNGSRVASIIYKKGYKFSDEQIMELHNNNFPVASFEVNNGRIFENSNIQKLLDSKGVPVAHNMAEKGYIFKDKETLNLTDKFGTPTSIIMARNGHIFEDKDFLIAKDSRGTSVAHIQTENNWSTKDKSILMMQDDNGVSVAHLLAKKNHAFKDKSISSLMDHNGKDVAYYMAKNGHAILDADTLSQVYAISIPVPHSNNMGGQRNSSRWGGAPNQKVMHQSLFDILNESHKFDINNDKLKKDADILSIVTHRNKAPIALTLYRETNFVPDLETAKKMRVNSLIVLIEDALMYNKDALNDFKHLMDDQSLLLQVNSKNYSVAHAFKKVGVEFENEEVKKFLAPKSAVNWREGVFPSGKNKGKTFGEIADQDPNYIQWCHKEKKYNIDKYITPDDVSSLAKKEVVIKAEPKKELPKASDEIKNDDWRNLKLESGKNEGKTLGELADKNPTYLEWCHTNGRCNVDKLMSMETIQQCIDNKIKNNVNKEEPKKEVAPKEEAKIDDSWKEMVIGVGKFKTQTLGDLCETKKGYISYMHEKGMKVIVDNIPSEVINNLNNDDKLIAYNNKKTPGIVQDAGELDM